MTTKNPETTISVGDVLAFEDLNSFGRKRELHKIEKITSSGRITCGPHTLNPDLSIRGKGYGNHQPICIGKPTPSFLKELEREKQILHLKNVEWENLDTDLLKAVYDLVKKP